MIYECQRNRVYYRSDMGAWYRTSCRFGPPSYYYCLFCGRVKIAHVAENESRWKCGNTCLVAALGAPNKHDICIAIGDAGGLESQIMCSVCLFFELNRSVVNFSREHIVNRCTECKIENVLAHRVEQVE